MPAISALAKTFARVLSNNSPKILTGMAVTGVVSTTVLAVKATPQALDKIHAFEIKEFDGAPGMSAIDKVKETWLCYVPAASVGAVTIACIISANSINTKRNTALMSLYSITETGFREYQEKMVASLGQSKEQAIRDELVQERLDRDPVSSKEVLMIGTGTVLCYDTMTARYFMSDMETIRKAQNDINQKIFSEMYASRNDFYRLIALPIVANGEEDGWGTDNMLEIDFTTAMSDDNRPCLSLNYRTDPIRGYSGNSFLR